ncbi:unnamed protein product [Pleuronectes platessa]|uniref:Uncharacterized protein n=1 Tax=Pleuronectes platessa TaxID=8262 RepID=A0A9N7YBW1_PLEPL|nr:unnamed protein product [Pleuronectes platessa]
MSKRRRTQEEEAQLEVTKEEKDGWEEGKGKIVRKCGARRKEEGRQIGGRVGEWQERQDGEPGEKEEKRGINKSSDEDKRGGNNAQEQKDKVERCMEQAVRSQHRAKDQGYES